MDTRFRAPFTMMIVGATCVGKTRFVIDLLRSNSIDTQIDDRIVCYSEWQPAYNELKQLGCRFIHGLLDPEELDPSIPHLVILDDLMDRSKESKVDIFFTRSAHHKNASTIYIAQNLYCQGAGHRTASLNTQYLVLFRTPRDMSQIRTLESQMFPGKKGFLIESFNHACEKPYNPLVIDLKPDTPAHLRVRGRVLDTQSQDVYCQKDYKWSSPQLE